MRTSSEIKKNNIRKANMMMESNFRTNKGQIASKFGLYEQCGTQLDTDGEYMGAPIGTEPMDMMGNEMGMDFDMMDDGMDFDIMDDEMDDEMDMFGDDDDDDEMMAMFMAENIKGGGDCERDEDYVGNQTGCEGKCPNCGPCGICPDAEKKADDDTKKTIEEGPSPCPGMSCKQGMSVDTNTCKCVRTSSLGESKIGMNESYKAVSATPTRDSWGNEYNNILTESNQVSGIKSLIGRMNRVQK